MALDDALDQRESHTGAFELFARMQPLEDAKQLLRMVHAETHSVVTDEVQSFGGVDATPNLDSRYVPRKGVFYRVPYQVDEYLNRRILHLSPAQAREL